LDAGGRPAHDGGVRPITWWGGLSRRRRLLMAVLALVVGPRRFRFIAPPGPPPELTAGS